MAKVFHLLMVPRNRVEQAPDAGSALYTYQTVKDVLQMISHEVD